MMNRQIRRAQAKQDKRADREKEERRAARVRKIQQFRDRRVAARAAARERAAARAAGRAPAPAPSGEKSAPRRTGRFSGALMIATIFFIVLQSSVPPEPGGSDVLRSVTGAGFFLLFGYFSVLWLMRRGVPKPLRMTWITGAFLLAGVEVAKLLQAVVPLDPLMIALAVPGVVAGSFLGRLVYDNAPA